MQVRHEIQIVQYIQASKVDIFSNDSVPRHVTYLAGHAGLVSHECLAGHVGFARHTGLEGHAGLAGHACLAGNADPVGHADLVGLVSIVGHVDHIIVVIQVLHVIEVMQNIKVKYVQISSYYAEHEEHKIDSGHNSHVGKQVLLVIFCFKCNAGQSYLSCR